MGGVPNPRTFPGVTAMTAFTGLNAGPLQRPRSPAVLTAGAFSLGHQRTTTILPNAPMLPGESLRQHGVAATSPRTI